ncbi:thioredoxin family protein [Carboxylicivirga sp. RSCT41]|uniref:thioredoxin family protein n=1 Tax=Carboxylicivirga agarovorans TaxID=3417570 RepID=UPI003D3409C1
MKIFLSILFSIIVTGSYAQTGDGISFTHGSWSEIKQLAKDQNKAIFIDCYLEWCGPCKMLSKDVFPQKEVGELFNTNFINYKVDMEKGEGPMLKKQFNVAAFPTLVWVDAEGNELHKSVGAPKAEDLIKTAQLVIDGKGLAALQRQYESKPGDYSTMLQYIEALANAYEKQKIQEVLSLYFESVKETDLLAEKNYMLIKNYLSDIYSPAFIWFHKHADEFQKQYPDDDIEQKIYRTYLSYGHSLVKKNEVNYSGYKAYCKTLKKRKVVDRKKIQAYIDESICRAEQNWDAYIEKVKDNMQQGYHDLNNSFLYYNWAKAIDNSTNAEKEHYEQAAQWMEKAFEVSIWPLVNNIVYLDEKLKILEKAHVDNQEIIALKKRIGGLREEVSKEK